tara:strand:- start:1961 stop:2290 length:330 start_codon:yes stop_codon:yes gene_type:complete
MPEYVNYSAGHATTADDPLRAVWFSSGCTFWTDDFSLLEIVNGIPCCPKCGAPGFMCDAKNWALSAAEFADDGHEGYEELLDEFKATCGGPNSNLMKEYKEFKGKRYRK